MWNDNTESQKMRMCISLLTACWTTQQQNYVSSLSVRARRPAATKADLEEVKNATQTNILWIVTYMANNVLESSSTYKNIKFEPETVAFTTSNYEHCWRMNSSNVSYHLICSTIRRNLHCLVNSLPACWCLHTMSKMGLWKTLQHIHWCIYKQKAVFL